MKTDTTANGSAAAPAPASGAQNLTLAQFTAARQTARSASAAAAPVNEGGAPANPNPDDEPKAPAGEGAPANDDTTANPTADAAEAPRADAAEGTPAEGEAEGAGENGSVFHGRVSPTLEAELTPLVAELKSAGSKGALRILEARIPKLVDQRDTERNARLQAEERARQLEARLKDAPKAATSPAHAADPYDAHPDIAPLTEKLTQLDHNLDWLYENPEGGIVDQGNGQTLELTAEQVRKLRADAEKQRTNLAAQKAAKVERLRTTDEATTSQAFTQAETFYPWLKDDKSTEAQVAAVLEEKLPELKRRPEWPLLLADLASAATARLKARSAPAKPAASLTRKPASTPAPVGAPNGHGGGPAKPSGQVKVQQSEENFAKRKDLSSLNELRKARRAAAEPVGA